jgi:hypothetical protein
MEALCGSTGVIVRAVVACHFMNRFLMLPVVPQAEFIKRGNM